MSFIFDNKIQFADTPQLDAFGRLRVSEPFTLFDSSFLVDKKPNLWGEDSTGTASATHLPNESSVELSVGAASGDRMLRRTFEWFRYQPAKSLLVFNTFVLGAKTNNVTKRVGYFSDDDGIFLEQTGSDLAFVLRTSTSGTPSDARRITQTGWNIDKFDGTGPSGITLDDTQAQILFMDMEWLGVGRVRVGFVINGIIYPAHEFLNANQSTSVYMKRASLPVSYEILNTAATSGITTFKQICSSVISEGGYNETFSTILAQRTAVKNVTTSGFVPMLSVRLDPTYARSKLKIQNIEFLSTSSDYFAYRIVIRHQLIVPSFTNISDATQIDTQSNAVVGGIQIAGGLVARNRASGLAIDSEIAITSDLDGTPHNVSLEVISLTNDATCRAAMNIKEIY